MERILGEIVLQNKSITTPIDYVLCIGNFLGKVSFLCNQMLIIQLHIHGFWYKGWYMLQDEDVYTFFEPELTKNTMSSPYYGSGPLKKVSSTLVDVKGDNYFSVAVGNTHTKASYFLDSSDDVVQLIHKLCTHNNPWLIIIWCPDDPLRISFLAKWHY